MASAIFRDADGARYARERTPRDLEIALGGARLGSREPPDVALVLGGFRASVAVALGGARSALRAHAVATELELRDHGWVLRPKAALDPLARYTLLWLDRAAPNAWAFRTAADVALGARLRGSLPGPAAVEVPLRLARAVLQFEGELRDDLRTSLALTNGEAVLATTLESVPCESLGLHPGSCAVLAAREPLAPRTRYTIRSGELRSATGARIEPISIAFDTSELDDTSPPLLQATPCLADEQSVGTLCVRSDDRVAWVRGAVDEAAFVSLAASSHRQATLSVANQFELAIPLSASSDARLSLTDVAGNSRDVPLSLALFPPYARVLIDELRADPSGSEPAAEYVEIWNAEDAPVILRGFTLAVGERTRAIPGDAVLAPGERALLVGPEFDPLAPAGAIPSGVRVVRLSEALSLPNGGGLVRLRDGDGRLSSMVRFAASLLEGQCHAREGGELSRGPVRLSLDPDGACTPGAPTLHEP